MTLEEALDAVESMRAERDAARAHTEQALDAAAKSRAEAREAFLCGAAVLGGLVETGEAIRLMDLRRRFLRAAQEIIIGTYGSVFEALARTGRTCSREPNPHPKCSVDCPNDMHGSFCALDPDHLGTCKQ